jgi:hypothetical protein
MLDELLAKGGKPAPAPAPEAEAISAAEGFGVDEAGETEASRSARTNLFDEDSK